MSLKSGLPNLQFDLYTTMFTDFQTMKDRITESNKHAADNENYYPIQEQATLKEIWEYVPSNCPPSCTCRKFGCTHHWKLKNNVRFDDFTRGFLRMFVYNRQHQSVISALKSSASSVIGVNPRVEGAVHVLRDLQKNWNVVSVHAQNHNKSLICDDWDKTPLAEYWSFRVRGSDIYEVKKYCVLLPDICMPYDTSSRNEVLRQFKKSRVHSYYDLLRALRFASIEVMARMSAALNQFRNLDAPQEKLPFDPYKITLRKPEFDYGKSYEPAYRPISRILDKCFYRP
ncbi:MAG: hypothetical protein NTZ24_15415 [Deltaproteobacteria bacterium]|nr:hypothetical protein [Deltaproteobacteria bacterium]